jgi:hypothetical protein
MIGDFCPTAQGVPWTDLRDANVHNPGMPSADPRAILAANLRRMIEADLREGEKLSVRAWAMGKGLDVRLIDRLVKEENAVTLDTLTKIADACGLQPWHLLLPDLAPGVVPDAPISEEERRLLGRLRKLLDS